MSIHYPLNILFNLKENQCFLSYGSTMWHQNIEVHVIAIFQFHTHQKTDNTLVFITEMWQVACDVPLRECSPSIHKNLVIPVHRYVTLFLQNVENSLGR